ncbi:MAG: thiamine phosphate synthase [Alphaproteobacteria bacterium]
MASERERARLARAAFLLNRAAGFAGMLPPLVLMTDERLRDPLASVRALPQGAGVVVRARRERERAMLAREIASIAGANRLVLLIAGDAALADAVNGHGLHLPEARMAQAAQWKGRRPQWLITVAAHSAHALRRASEFGADAAFLAPVFATASHPGRAALGPLRFMAIARASRVPVYALGGITAANVGRLAGAPIAGIAAVDGLSVAPSGRSVEATS